MELEQDIYALCQKLVETCAAKGLTVSTAESCTAGLVAAHIADVSGASACLKGGAVTYCDEAKQALLGVSPDRFGDGNRFSPGICFGYSG